MSARRPGAVSATVLLVLAVTLVVGVLRTAAPAWAQRVGLDVWNLRSLRENARSADERDGELDARRERLRQEIEFTGHVAARLAAGTQTLWEAVEALEPLLCDREGFDIYWKFQHRCPTFRQGVARYIINHACWSLEDDPTRQAEVSARLEAEYATLD